MSSSFINIPNGYITPNGNVVMQDGTHGFCTPNRNIIITDQLPINTIPLPIKTILPSQTAPPKKNLSEKLREIKNKK